MNPPVQGTLIDGFSDEVIMLLVVIPIMIWTCLILLNQYLNSLGNRNITIHPLQEQAVQQARSHLNSSNDFQAQNGRTTSRVSYGTDSVCPICLLRPSEPVETNCGHIFCSECILTYWRHGSWLGPVNCPVCRQQVTILFSDQQSADIANYNRRFSGASLSIWDYISDFPTLLRHFFRELFSVNGMVMVFRIRLVACVVAVIIYIFLPFDIIPEAVFGVLGFIDDLFVIFVMLMYVTIIYRNIIASR